MEQLFRRRNQILNLANTILYNENNIHGLWLRTSVFGDARVLLGVSGDTRSAFTAVSSRRCLHLQPKELD
ncbi:hypothetical protein AV530_002113 [Patagioenas fasciata monilis]|uniref:Uncharacterized protein n=1 Tax=Patagioenas fasciata monilis TaxID=372326 RepID=A0A1V4J738_PATFA|nr:hypothetical protein AV530_002113 [Patagioenas fasciata monilis]